jgi:hypothetical protein
MSEIDEVGMSAQEMVDWVANICLDPAQHAPPPPMEDRPAKPKRGFVSPYPEGELFISVPIRVGWLDALNELGKPTRRLGHLLWYVASRYRRTTFFLTTDILAPFGVSAYQKGRALKALEKAGLISVKQGQGLNPLVTINLNAGPSVTWDGWVE